MRRVRRSQPLALRRVSEGLTACLLTEIHHPSGLRETFTYDDLGRVKTASKHVTGFASPLTTTNVFDVKSRLTQTIAPKVTSGVTNPSDGRYHRNSSSTEFTPNGNVDKVTTTDIETGVSRWIAYGYDDADRRDHVSDSAGRTASRTYDANGNVASETDYTHATTAYTYNSRNLVETMTAKDVVDDPIAGSPAHDVALMTYGYDKGGRKTWQVDANGQLTRTSWRGDGRVDLTVVANAPDLDPDTGLPRGTERTVLVSAAEMDPVGNPLTTFAPTNVAAVDEFEGSALSSAWQKTGSWSVSNGDLVAGAPGAAWRNGTRDGHIQLRMHEAPLLSVRFRVKDASNYCEIQISDGEMRAVQVIDGVSRKFQHSFSGLPEPGDWLDVIFTGNRVRAYGNGVLMLNGWIPTDTSDAGVGVAALAGGESTTTFRFDAYQRTASTYDAYGRLTGATVDPGGANARTEWELKPDGRPVAIRRSNADNPIAAEETRIDYVPNGQPGAGQPAWSAEVIANPDPDSSLDDVVAQTTYSYDERGLPTKVVLPEGGEVDSIYDEMGQLVRETGPERTLVRYNQADGSGRPSTTYGYNAFGDQIDEEDAAGNLTSYEYDQRGLLIEWTLPSYVPPSGTAVARTMSSTFDDMGRVRTQTDSLGEVTKFTYNTRGLKVAEELPAVGSSAAGVQRFVYDNAGNLVGTTDPTGAVVNYRLDGFGRRAAMIQQVRQPSATSYVSSSVFGDAGGVLRTHTAEGVVTTSEYDVAGRMLHMRDADGNATRFGYDDFQRITSVTTPDGGSTRMAYNLVGDPLTETQVATNGATRVSRFTWDREHHNLTAATPRGVVGDANGPYATSMVYDEAGQLIQRTTPASGVGAGVSAIEKWGYDQLGQVTRYTDGRNNQTWQTYNVMGLPEDAIKPAAGPHTAVADRRWRTTYDPAGQPTSRLAPGGVSVTSTYDELGRVLQQLGSGAQATTAARSFTYDLVGRPKTAGTPTASQTFNYDDRGLLMSSSGASGASEFVYDGDGRLVQQTDSAGIAQYSYDNRGLPDAVSSSLSGTAGYQFDTSGRPSMVDYGNGTTRAYTYDIWGQVDLDRLTTNSNELYKADYDYDADGNIVGKNVSGSNVPAAGANSYAYDRASRITGWQAAGGVSETYVWDKASNRIQSGSPVAPTTATFDEQNRLVTTSGPGGLTTNTWSANGTLDQQQVQRQVTLVVGDPANQTSADAVLTFIAVASANAAVTTVDDAAAAPAATSTDVVVISPSVNATTIGTKYKDIAAPVVNIASATWQANGLISAAPLVASGTSAFVSSPGHPIAAGKTGSLALISSSDTLTPAAAVSLGAGAVKVWTTSSSSTDTVVAAYDGGSAMAAGAAAGRRVTIGLSAGALGKIVADGGNVYAEAIKWADNNIATTFGPSNFDFDAFEQLSKIVVPGAPVANHTYDALGRRLTSPTGSLSYAGAAIRPSADGANRYQPGPVGVVGIDDMTNGGGVWAHTDAHSDVVGTFSPGASQLTSAQTFSPWGQALARSGAAIPMAYQSERGDLPGGLIGMGVREYDPSTGTFISHDPIFDPLVPNGYSYTPADPLGFTDPSGMEVCGICEQAIDYIKKGAKTGKKAAGKVKDVGEDLIDHVRGRRRVGKVDNDTGTSRSTGTDYCGGLDVCTPPGPATPITASCRELALIFGDDPSAACGGGGSGPGHTGNTNNPGTEEEEDDPYGPTEDAIRDGIGEPTKSPMSQNITNNGTANDPCSERELSTGKSVDTGNACLITTFVVPTVITLVTSTVPELVLTLVSGQSDERTSIPGSQRVGEGECGYAQGRGDVGWGDDADATWDCDSGTDDALPGGTSTRACSHKRGPKPWPTGSHNETIQRRIMELVSLGYEHISGGSLTEEYIRTPGGIKGARRPDITMRAPDGSIYRENVGRSTASGEPVAREVAALNDIEAATGSRPGYTSYDGSC